MKKNKKHALNRPAKALLYLFFALFLALTIYVGLGCPPLNTEMVFRRAERAHMVGPSQILAEFSNGRQFPRSVIVAETEDSHILYTVQRQEYGYRRFYTNPKEGQIDNYTFRTYPKTEAPVLYNTSMSNASPIQLVLFDQSPNAVRAELTAKLTYTYRERVHIMDIQAESLREYDSFFLFSLQKPQDSSEQWYYAMRQLVQTDDEKPELTLRLYDEEGNLIATHSFTPGQNGSWQKG